MGTSPTGGLRGAVKYGQSKWRLLKADLGHVMLVATSFPAGLKEASQCAAEQRHPPG